jgi:sensor histidine kinase YesM
VLGGLLFCIIPFTITLDHLNAKDFPVRLASFAVLLILVVMIFYVSLYINMRYYKTSIKKIWLANIIAFFVISIISFSIHYPFWMCTPPIQYFVRDDIVRNITVFAVSCLAATYYMKNKENQQIQMTLAQLEKENLSNQVRGLTQQLNPHFFFNALNTLSGIVQESPEKSERFIDKLSQVFRYVLKLQNYDTMMLEEELQFMDDYIYLLKIRFEEMLIIHVSNPLGGGYRIVPLCTQLLLENVIKHNKISRLAPVTINITTDEEYLTVSNTYQPKADMGSSKLGLANLDKRCLLYADKPIIVEQTNGLFTVKVPLMKV